MFFTVLLIGLVILGVFLFILLIICSILTCTRRRPNSQLASQRSSRGVCGSSGATFLPHRASLDRRAMIQDSSSETSHSETNILPYVVKNKKQKSSMKKVSVADLEQGDSGTLGEQRDRSLTVMIPRAKYHPASPNSPLMNMHHDQGYEKRKISSTSTEAKLLSYLDAGPSPNKVRPTIFW